MTRGEAARQAGVSVDEWRSIERSGAAGDNGLLDVLSSKDWRDDWRVGDVLDHGDPLYVAVSTAAGVHVVPVNFTCRGRRLWFFTMRRTLKVEALRRRPAVGALVRWGDSAVMMTGRAKVVDVPTGRGVSPNRLLKLPPAAAAYAVRNAKVLAGSACDRPAPTWPLLNMIPVSIQVDRVALLEHGEVVATWGDWARRPPADGGAVTAAPPPGAHRLPFGLQRLLRDSDRPAVLGWESACGPVAVPADWHWSSGLFETGVSPLTLAGASDGMPVCAVVDRYGSRLKDHEGVLMAGRGHLELTGETARVAMDHRRLTYWHMDDSETVWRAP